MSLRPPTKRPHFRRKRRLRPGYKTGYVSQEEQSTIEGVVADVPAETPTDRITEALEPALNRSPELLASYVTKAKLKLAERASRYADIHYESVRRALKDGKYETARKGSWEYLTGVGVKDSNGQVQQVIDKPVDEGGGGVTVMIGIKLGGIPEPSDS